MEKLIITIFIILISLTMIACEEKPQQNVFELDNGDGTKSRGMIYTTKSKFNKLMDARKKHGSISEILANPNDPMMITINKVNKHIKKLEATSPNDAAMLAIQLQMLADSYNSLAMSYDDVLEQMKALAR